jgi:DNA repair photolyase
MLKINEVRAKSILNKSKIFDYCLNPYTGCEHNCTYCYARLFMRRYSGHKEPWGEFVDVKINAPELLKKQLEKAKMGTVWISSVCDPYQPLEAKYKLTRQCLKELAEKQFPVNIQTKSKLALRDLDLFLQFKKIKVGFTVTTDDERIAKLFEPKASSVKERLNALQKINSKGIRTFVFVGPLLPGSPEKLVQLLEGKTDKIYIDKMNYLDTIRGFYHHQNLEGAATDKFFRQHKERFIDELRKRKIKFEVLF